MRILTTEETMTQTLTVLFKSGLRTDGEIACMTISQEGVGELRLTMEQAKTLQRVLNAKFGEAQR